MAADRRTRRLNPEPGASQRTLDPRPEEAPAPAVPESGATEASVPTSSAVRLEERQARWFRARERLINPAQDAAVDPAKRSADPKA